MRARCVALVPVLGLFLAGCSDPSEPKALPVPTQASPASSLAPTAAAVPSEAVGETPQAAEAFARFYYEQVARAYAEADPQYVRAVSATSCTSCAALASAIETRRKNGNNYRGGEVTIRSAIAAGGENGTNIVTVVYDAAMLSLLDASGRVVQSRKALKNVVTDVTLRRTAASWIVVSVQQAEGES